MDPRPTTTMVPSTCASTSVEHALAGCDDVAMFQGGWNGVPGVELSVDVLQLTMSAAGRWKIPENSGRDCFACCFRTAGLPWAGLAPDHAHPSSDPIIGDENHCEMKFCIGGFRLETGRVGQQIMFVV